MENVFSSIWGDVLDMYTDDFPEVDKELLNKFSDFMMQSSRERAAKEKAAWEEKRKSLTWTIEEWNHTKEFDDKYQDASIEHYYIIKNNKRNTYFQLFVIHNSDIKKTEQKLNSERYVELTKIFEDKYADNIMESCHGKDWKKTHSPYHLATYSVIFDTHTGEIIYETHKEPYHHAYISFYDNVAEISQERHDTVYFDMQHRKELIKGKYDKIESKDYIILGKSHYYGIKKENATIINKHTGEITILN